MRNCICALLGILVIIAGTEILYAQDQKPGAVNLNATSVDALAELYENLAESIIKIRASEDILVRGLLVQYHAAAQRNLAEAAEKTGNRVAQLEGAATQIANIANEGDKRVRAVRQRLSEAGHYHQKDAQSSDDFMFINAKEKASLLALAKKVGGLGAAAEPAAIKTTGDELRALFTKSIGRE